MSSHAVNGNIIAVTERFKTSKTYRNYKAQGNERFLAEMAAALGQRVTRGKAGRPRTEPVVESGDLFV